MRRLGAAIVAALLLVGLSAPATFAAASTRTNAVPKVVFVVGPAGDATAGYRAEARAAASVARHYTPDVVELYSPNATWPAVQQALKGASLVVYMGHGNGWPSRYHDSLFPESEDGFGLNPTTNGNDATHQYFGETDIAAQVKLARNAVVVLDHLCYASGLSEPGLPEGTLDQAHQRIDNYAAGFIKAGAAAVVAEAWSSPSYMVRSILGGGRSIQTAWQDAPSANGHRSAFTSTRSPGYVAQMDTETAASGFTRSIVMKAGLAPADVRAGAAGSASAALAAPGLPLEPTLIGTGITLGTPDIAKLPAAGTLGHVDVPFSIKNRRTLTGLEASVRWDPIEMATVLSPSDPATEVGGGGTPSPTAPATTPAPDPSSTPTTGPSMPPGGPLPAIDPTAGPDLQHDVTVSPTSGATASAAPATASAAPASSPDQLLPPPDENLDLVVPEQTGDVVAPAAVVVGKKALNVPVSFPSVPGRYRLTVSLHDHDGVAYDAATQAMIPSLIVRVTGDYDGAIQAAPTADLATGAKVTLGVRVVNLGTSAWGDPATTSANEQPAFVVGRWIPLSVDAELSKDPSDQVVGAPLPIGLEPGVSVEAQIALTAPPAAGDYLLLLDVVTPERGSLVASGADPALIRVTVSGAPTP